MSDNDENEFLKIQTHVLKVQINCLGCRKKVKKLLKKIEGVYQVSMDVEEQKVTVSGNVDAEIVIMKLLKSGKHAELLSMQELENQEKGAETWYSDGEYQNPELLNDDHHNMELLKWLSDENNQNQVHSRFNGVRASKRQPLPQLYESGIDQLGNEKFFKQSMAFESEEGERDNKFSTIMEMDNPHVHQDYASIVGRRENSMMDFLSPKSNFPYLTTMEGNEHAELAGHQYHYPPYSMMNNMQVYQYRNPSPMTVNPYMQRMHSIENMDNVYMYQPWMVTNHKFDMVPPISYWQNMHMNSYHI